MKCVHLDFHTSPHIKNIGCDFDSEKFTEVIKRSKIDLVTVFAKCHHGYTYYPSKVCEMHPGLSFNLLGEELKAIRRAGAKAPIYITMGWSKKDADEHPEWHMRNFHTKESVYMNGKPSDDPEAPLEHCSWTTLCPLGGYADHLEAVTREVLENFDASDGIFYDICFISDACGCDACLSGMKKMGLDPESYEDAKKYYTLGRIEMMKKLTGIVHEYYPNAPVFYNGGANMNRPEFHPYQTHFEMEDLPTAWGGYDLMPLRAKFFEKYGKVFWGMTGKFHHAWGEFGGFKNKDALKYECADMLSVGASISVGDHLHPAGALDESTYNLMSYAFDYVSKIEGLCENTKAYTKVALWLTHRAKSDIGASKLLQIMHLEFDVVESGESLDGYELIILPEGAKLSEADETRLREFVADGGKLVAAYDSVPSGLGVEKIAPSKLENDFIKYNVDCYVTPFLSYSNAYKVKTDGEWLAQVYEPFFNRTAGHFCGHKNTPYKTEPADYPALVKCPGLLYFAHPIFESYERSGNYVLEQYFITALESFRPGDTVAENFPSVGRLRLRKSLDGERFILHMLYAPPVNRGNVCLLPDFPYLHGVKVQIRTDEKIKRVYTAPDCVELDFEERDGRVFFEMPPFSLHKIVVLEK